MPKWREQYTENLLKYIIFSHKYYNLALWRVCEEGSFENLYIVCYCSFDTYYCGTAAVWVLYWNLILWWSLPFTYAVIMFLISWSFTVVSLLLASLIYKYVSIKGKAGDWGDGFKSAYFQLALRSLRSLGGKYHSNLIIYSSQVNTIQNRVILLILATIYDWMVKNSR